MRLDYVPSTSAFVLYVQRGEHDIEELMHRHGLDFSASASTPAEAVLFTREEYAALPFWRYATDRAENILGDRIEMIQASKSLTGPSNLLMPEGRELVPFQAGGVTYCMRVNSALIGDAPGLGKTPQAIVLANELKAKKIAVVCPANIRLQWAVRIREWSTMIRPLIYPILKSADGVNPHADWTILSYDLTRSEGIFEALKRHKFDLIILDESHYLKNNEAKRTQQVFGEHGLCANAGYVLSLTGTPLPNRPRECYTQARNLCWDSIDWMDEEDFRGKYNPSYFNGRFKREEIGRESELNARLRSHFMVRRTREEAQPQLPQVTHEITYIEEDGAIRKALQAEAMLDLDPRDILEGRLPAKIQGHISEVRKMMGVALAPHIAEFAEMVLKGGEPKIFLSGWHKEVLDIWEKRLYKHGIVRVDGKTTPGRKQIAVDRFIKDPKCHFFIANYMSGGVGTDGLQEVCCHAIVGEPSWVPGDNDQVVKRLDRMGQTLPVLANYMVAPGSLSERVLSSSLEKFHGIHRALDEVL